MPAGIICLLTPLGSRLGRRDGMLAEQPTFIILKNLQNHRICHVLI
jgi:hypothetical protein